MINPTKLLPELKEVANALPIPLLLLNNQGQCTFANSAWEKLTGKSEVDALGNGWSLLAADTDASRLAQSLTNLMQQHESFVQDLNYLGKDGKKVWVRAKFINLMSESGTSSGFLCTLVEIDTLRSQIESLERQNQDLDNLNKLLIDRELKMIELKKMIKKSQ